MLPWPDSSAWPTKCIPYKPYMNRNNKANDYFVQLYKAIQCKSMSVLITFGIMKSCTHNTWCYYTSMHVMHTTLWLTRQEKHSVWNTKLQCDVCQTLSVCEVAGPRDYHSYQTIMRSVATELNTKINQYIIILGKIINVVPYFKVSANRSKLKLRELMKNT